MKVTTYARAGLLGNPSDGFFGKTISIPIKNFSAEIEINPSKTLHVEPTQSDLFNYKNLDGLIEDVEVNGYYGGFRIIKAAIKKFYEYTKENNIQIANKNFGLKYSSNIPRQVGLAGSSAIIAATLTALTKFYDVKVPKEILPNIVLNAETEELDISAGLQDRVVQVYGCPVFMDFDKKHLKKHGFGKYTPLNVQTLPKLYLGYKTSLTHKPTVHNNVRALWESGDEKVIKTLDDIAKNAEVGIEYLQKGDLAEFNKCINKNFDLRSKIYNIHPENEEMIKVARKVGATSKFPGSGGAVIGTYNNDVMFKKLHGAFSDLGCEIIAVLT
ncbi:GHMP kinase [bacterium]|nr:GHMP kinase [bacterium]